MRGRVSEAAGRELELSHSFPPSWSALAGLRLLIDRAPGARRMTRARNYHWCNGRQIVDRGNEHGRVGHDCDDQAADGRMGLGFAFQRWAAEHTSELLMSHAGGATDTLSIQSAAKWSGGSARRRRSRSLRPAATAAGRR